jgi:hypothetical protein
MVTRAALIAQNNLTSAWIGERHVLKRPDAPSFVSLDEHRENKRIDFMRSGRMSKAGSQSAPEMYHRYTLIQMIDIYQLIRQRGVAINGFVNGSMERHDFIDTSNIVSKTIHECGPFSKQAAKRGHVVGVPGRLKRCGYVFGSIDFGHEVIALCRLSDGSQSNQSSFARQAAGGLATTV